MGREPGAPGAARNEERQTGEKAESGRGPQRAEEQDGRKKRIARSTPTEPEKIPEEVGAGGVGWWSTLFSILGVIIA